jgi:tetratricopeptide (TPR) repeat protein
MTRFQRTIICIAAIILIPGAVAVGWWYYLPDYLLAQAERAVATNDLARAETLLQRVNRQAPDCLRARLLHAQVLRRLKRPAEAQAVLRQAMKLGLPEAVGHREFALAEAVRGFSPHVEKHLQQALEDNPDEVEVLQALAEGYAQSERWPEADRCYTRLLELQTEQTEYLLARGRARLSAVGAYKGRTQDAAADFREILRRFPDHYEARLYLAHCLLSDARIPEAKVELLRCQELAPDKVEPLVGLAACAVEERAWDQAETMMRRALDRDPKSTYVLGMLGDLYLRRQHFQQAIPFFRQVLDLEPRNKAARLKLAQALRYTGQFEQAKEQERIYQDLAEERAPPNKP